MGESSDKHRKWYADRPSGKTKTCLIHGHGNYSDECKVLGYFGANYSESNPTKDSENHPVQAKILNIQQENNDIVNNMVYEILLYETQKLGAAKEAPEFLDPEYDDNEMYQDGIMSLEDNKENLNDVSMSLNIKRKVHMVMIIK